MLDGGETNGADRLPFLDQGILDILSKAHGCIGLILEHRYYGESVPVKNLTTDSLRYLTTLQSLHDSAYFVQNVELPGYEKLNLSSVPLFYYGGSYAGAKSAFARKLFPGIWWGAIASSAVTEAIIDFHDYWEPIKESAPEACISTLQKDITLLDSLLDLNNSFVTSSLKSFFGLPNVTRSEDFVNALSIPLGSWQARNWDPQVGSNQFEEFCQALTTSEDNLASTSLHRSKYDLFAVLEQRLAWPSDPRKAFSDLSRYAAYTRENIASLCPPEANQDSCFGTSESGENDDENEISDGRSWSWQVCTEWGYFQTASPNASTSIISKLITLEYTSEMCREAYPPGKLVHVPAEPDVALINSWGGFGLDAERLAFIDGSADPWLYATPHSPLASEKQKRKRKDTISKPFKLIKGGVHHWDENGDPRFEPKEIRKVHEAEVEFVGRWIREFNERGHWRPEA